jgi:hypothetical protein
LFNFSAPLFCGIDGGLHVPDGSVRYLQLDELSQFSFHVGTPQVLETDRLTTKLLVYGDYITPGLFPQLFKTLIVRTDLRSAK